jgi:hypothetical protein
MDEADRLPISFGRFRRGYGALLGEARAVEHADATRVKTTFACTFEMRQ